LYHWLIDLSINSPRMPPSAGPSTANRYCAPVNFRE
jgi:hypothetical protein